MRICAASTFALLLLLSWRCWGDPPSITHTEPSSLPPGKITQLRLFGTNLSSVQTLWTSFPAQSKLINSATSAPLFEVVVPNDAGYGIGAIRVAGADGISSLHLLLLDDMPVTNAVRTNITAANAQQLIPPVAVAGFSEELNFTFFKVRAKRGEKLTMDVYAQRLGSRLDPHIRVLQPDGNEVAYCDDDPAVGRDSRLTWAAPRSGEYVIELRDISYRGGTPFRYCMKIGRFPAPTVVFPSAAPPGVETQFSFLTSSAERIPTLKATLSTTMARAFLPVPKTKPKEHTWMPVLLSSLPQIREQEPNDSTNGAQKIEFPIALHGIFQKEKDRDYFRFTAQGDDRLIFRGLTRSFGSPCDVFMELYDSAGKKVTEAKIAGPDEPAITNKFEKAGDYFLLVEELNYFGAPDLTYRLEIERYRPAVQLSVATDRVNTTNASRFEVNVVANRADYNGPIRLEISGLGPAASVTNNIIAEKKTNTVLKVSLAKPIQLSAIHHFHLTGHLEHQGKNYTVPVRTTAALRRLFGGLLYPPVEFDGLIGLGTSATNVVDLAKDDDE